MAEQAGLAVKVDGLQYFFMADGSGLSKEGHIRSSIHCYNGISLEEGLMKTAESFFKTDPYIVVPAHSNGFATHEQDKDEYKEWATETTDAVTALLSPPFQDLGYDPYWASFYPARVHVKPGAEVRIALRLKNYTNRELTGTFSPVAYGNLSFRERTVSYDLMPGETRDIPFTVTVDKKAGKGIHIVTANIVYDGELYVEYPQAYLEIDE